MGIYINGSLRNGEYIRHEAHISLWSLAPGFLMGAMLLLCSVFAITLFTAENLQGIGNILSAVLIVIGIFTLTRNLAKYYTTELAVTNKRVIAKTGWFSRSTIELLIHKVESIQVQQPASQRLFGYGSLVISAAGEENAEFSGISDPIEFRDQYYEAEENAKLEIAGGNEAAAAEDINGVLEHS